MPSITSTTLTLLTDNDLAISCAIPVILLALVPGAGWISNLVTTGPGRTDSTLASMPNSSSLVSSKSAIWLSSASVKDEPSSKALSKSSVLGITALDSDSLGETLSISFSFVSVVLGRSGCLTSDEITLDEKSELFSDFLGFKIVLVFSICFSALFSAREFFFSFILTIRLLIRSKSLENNNCRWTFINFAVIKIDEPNKSIIVSHEKFRESDDAGIIKITRNIRLPIKPKALDKLIKSDLPIYPPAFCEK